MKTNIGRKTFFKQTKNTHRISEFRKFAKEIPPAEVRHPDGRWIVRVIDGLTFVTIVQQPSRHQMLK